MTETCNCADDEACDGCVPCDICREGLEECGCDGDPDCPGCYGAGCRIPEHCCDCGGYPYCVECHKCGASCFGGCRCPVTVQLEGGGTLTL